jgi:hypothetical protein
MDMHASKTYARGCINHRCRNKTVIKRARRARGGGGYTVSWWIRILNSIENVPQVHFSIEFNFKL